MLATATPKARTVELFGTTVESIRRFDVTGQRSTSALDAVEVTMLDQQTPDQEHFASYLPANTQVLLIEPREIDEQGGPRS